MNGAVHQLTRAANVLSKLTQDTQSPDTGTAWTCANCGLEHSNGKLRRCRDKSCQHPRKPSSNVLA
eukprot:8511397-Karenia_brevis.AAC.1